MDCDWLDSVKKIASEKGIIRCQLRFSKIKVGQTYSSTMPLVGIPILSSHLQEVLLRRKPKSRLLR